MSGFELLPYTNYTLFLSHDVKLHCDSTTLPLATDYAIHFTTGKDTVAPQILGPQVSVTSTTAAFSWETFQAANHRVRYGQSSLTSTAGDDSMGKYHRVQLANLQPGITYSYQLTSTDPSGNTGRTATSTFTTLKVNNVKVSDITDMAATITWQTNQPTDTLVEFGPDDQYGYRQGNGGQVTNHSLRLVDLNPDQTYHFRIVATNNAGTSTFDDAIFATLPATTVAGSRAANREDVSMSTDNIKLFPQVSFAQPLVLGASTAADTIYTGVTLGKNLLVRTGLPAQTWPSWLVTLIWLIPLLLLVAIGLVVWRLRQQKLENRK